MLKSSKTYLGFDFGLKKIGIATGQSDTRTATPLTTIKATNGQPDWNTLQSIIDDWQPDALIVGMPINMDGSFSIMAGQAKRFMKELHTHTKLPVYACDERLTTHEAKCLYRDLQQENKRIKLSIDSVAAKIILESWLENTTINATD